MKKVLVLLTGISLCVIALVAVPLTGKTQKQSKQKKTDEPLPAMDDNKPLEVEVWGGIRDLYKIAVPRPLGNSAVANEIQSVLSNDFKLSSLFQVLDPKSFLADLTAEGLTIDKDPWVQVGAQGVTKCKVTKVGNQLKLEFKLFEVPRGNKVVLSQKYTGQAKDARSLTHKWANLVIGYFTGEPGVFGTRLAFSRRISKTSKQVFTADWTGGDLARVTKNKAINLLPSFGPGGSVFYTSFVEGAPFLYRTGRRKAVLSHPGLNMGAAFHGGKMAVVLSKDGNPEIYLGNADGSGLKRLTNSGSIDVSPSFSPDGSKIAFVSDRHGSPQIFVMSAGGGGAKRITFRGSYNQTPSWCPKPGSNTIAFTGRDSGTYDIFTIDASGGSMRRLTQHQGRNMDPAFSPDCRAVAFHSSRGGIFISNPEGLNQNKVINGSADTIKWSGR